VADVSGVLGSEPSVYQLFADHETMVDPYPLYQRVLAERPVESTGGPVVLTRYADVTVALRHPGLSTDERNDAIYRAMAASGQMTAGVVAMMDRRSLLHRDPPDHTRLRSVLGAALDRDRIDRLTPVIQGLVDDAIDAVAGRGAIELIDDLAYPVPLAVACSLLGTTADEHRGAAWWRSQLCSDFEAPAVAGADCADYSRRVQDEMVACFEAIIDRKRQSPADDLVPPWSPRNGGGNSPPRRSTTPAGCCWSPLTRPPPTSSPTACSHFSGIPPSYGCCARTRRSRPAPSRKSCATTPRSSSPAAWPSRISR